MALVKLGSDYRKRHVEVIRRGDMVEAPEGHEPEVGNHQAIPARTTAHGATLSCPSNMPYAQPDTPPLPAAGSMHLTLLGPCTARRFVERFEGEAHSAG